jgi:WD40 repeat protein/tRNA A-37 threonylcarbamoyl transferase component Bud32
MAKKLESLLKQKNSELKTPGHLVSHFVLGIAVGSISKGDTFPLPMDFAATYKIEPTIVVEATRILEDREIVRVTNRNMIINANPSEAAQWFESAFHSETSTKSPGKFQPAFEIPVLEEVTIGEQDRYTKSHIIAQGGMGTIYSAYDNKLDRHIAIKVIKPGNNSKDATRAAGDPVSSGVVDEVAYKRFIREARVTARLDHPSIVPLYDISIDERGALQYSMKLIQGKTLSHAFKEASTLAERLLLIKNFLDVCNAVAYAHGQNVLHRDLKPSNIMLGEYGETIVIDWGLAKATETDAARSIDVPSETASKSTDLNADFTQMDEVLGTPGYIAPELFSDEPSSKQTDIYSLGAILYSLLSGNDPKSKSGKDTLVFENGYSLHKMDSELPLELVSICQKALNPNPIDRYASALELSEDIQSFLAGRLVKVHDYTPVDRMKKLYRRYKVYTISGIALATIVSVVSLSSALSIRSVNVQLEESNISLDKITQDSRLKLAVAHFNESAYSKTRNVLEEIPENFRRLGWHFLNTHANMHYLSLEGHEDSVGKAFEASGGRILTTAGSTVYIWNGATGELLNTFDHAGESISSATYHESANLLALGFTSGVVRMYDLDTNNIQFKARAHIGPVSGIAFDKIGHSLITVSPDKTLRFLDVSTGAPIRSGMVFEEPITRLAIGGKSHYLLVGLSIDETRVLDSISGERVARLPGRFAIVSDDERWIVSRYLNHLYVYDTERGEESEPLAFDDHKITDVSFGSGNDEIWIGDDNGTVFRMDLVTTEISDQYNHGGSITGITLNEDASQLATASKDGIIKTLDTETGRVLKRFEGHELPITSIKFFGDNQQFLLTSSYDRTAKTWNLVETASWEQVQAHDNTGTGMALSPDGSLIATIGYDNLLNIYSTKSFESLYQEKFISNPEIRGYVVQFSPDGKTLAFVSGSYDVYLMDVQSHQIIRALQGHTDVVTSISFTSDNKYLYSASTDEHLIHWMIDTGEIITNKKVGVIFDMIVAEDRNMIFLGTESGAIQGRDLVKMESIFDVPVHTDRISQLVRISEDTIASASNDGTLNLFNLETQTVAASLDGHKDKIFAIEYLPKYDRLVSCGRDNVTKVWNLETQESVLDIPTKFAKSKIVKLSAFDTTFFMLGDNGFLNRVSIQ